MKIFDLFVDRYSPSALILQFVTFHTCCWRQKRTNYTRATENEWKIWKSREKKGIDENQQQQVPFDEHEPKTKKNMKTMSIECKRKSNRECFTLSGMAFWCHSWIKWKANRISLYLQNDVLEIVYEKCAQWIRYWKKQENILKYDEEVQIRCYILNKWQIFFYFDSIFSFFLLNDLFFFRCLFSISGFWFSEMDPRHKEIECNG